MKANIHHRMYIRAIGLEGQTVTFNGRRHIADWGTWQYEHVTPSSLERVARLASDLVAPPTDRWSKIKPWRAVMLPNGWAICKV